MESTSNIELFHDGNLVVSKDIIVVIDSSLGCDQAIEEGICTYSYTKNRYSDQSWYMCKTCKIYCCIICKSNCHRDHEIGEENKSDFFCDCGPENKDCQMIKK